MEWLRGTLSAPSVSEDTVFTARSPSGEHVSFCIARIDWANEIADIDPVGTHPDHRRRGLARAVLLTCFSALAERGIRTAYIGSGAEPAAANRLYESLAPSNTHSHRMWSRAGGRSTA